MIHININKSSFENLLDALEYSNPDAEFKVTDNPDHYRIEVITQGHPEDKFIVKVTCDENSPMLTSPEHEFAFTPLVGKKLSKLKRFLFPSTIEEYDQLLASIEDGGLIQELSLEYNLPQDQFDVELIPADDYSPVFIIINVGNREYPLIRNPIEPNLDMSMSEIETKHEYFGFYITKPSDGPVGFADQLTIADGYGNETEVTNFIEYDESMGDVSDLRSDPDTAYLIPSTAVPGAFIVRPAGHTAGAVITKWGDEQMSGLNGRKIVGYSFSDAINRVDKKLPSLPEWVISGEYMFHGMLDGAFAVGFDWDDPYGPPIDLRWDFTNLISSRHMFSKSTLWVENNVLTTQFLGMMGVVDASHMFEKTYFWGGLADLNCFKFEAVENMDNIFFETGANNDEDDSEFDIDVSTWCVPKIASEPKDFVESGSEIRINRPVWGTCPLIS